MSERISSAVEWYAVHTPSKVAVIDGDSIITYAQLWERACRFTNALKDRGLSSGDRVALLLANSHRYIEIYVAAALMGIAVVPLNYRFVGHEIEYVVNHSEAKALVHDAGFTSVVNEVREKLTSIGGNYIISDATDAKWLSYESLIAAASAEPPPEPSGLDETFFQGYTSGTTGFPKGCINPHGPFVAQLQRIASLYEVTQRDIELTAAPLFHEAPALFTLAQIITGGTVVVTRDPDPTNLFRLIEKYRVTWTFMVPTMWATVIASPAMKSADVSSLRTLLSGGSPLLTNTKDAILEYFPDAGLNEFYGGTEVGLITNLGPEDQKRKLRSVGRPVYGMYVHLLGEDGEPVSQGEVGEIYIGGGTLLREYFKNPEATAAARKKQGWTLGDMGLFDEEGYLYIVDRKKDMIISGGENIFPTDIEDVLYKHPSVSMCAVVGAPDQRWGEVVVAAVVLKPGAAVTEEELIAHCRTRLANYKLPKKIEFLYQLPMSSFGKILRREVRRSYWEGQSVKV